MLADQKRSQTLGAISLWYKKGRGRHEKYRPWELIAFLLGSTAGAAEQHCDKLAKEHFSEYFTQGAVFPGESGFSYNMFVVSDAQEISTGQFTMVEPIPLSQLHRLRTRQKPPRPPIENALSPRLSRTVMISMMAPGANRIQLHLESSVLLVGQLQRKLVPTHGRHPRRLHMSLLKADPLFRTLRISLPCRDRHSTWVPSSMI